MCTGPQQSLHKTITAWGSSTDVDPQGLDLLSQLLVYEPSKRLSAKASLSHQYFDDLDKSQYH